MANTSIKPKRLHPLMLVGTGSDVGKSVLSTALCRIFLQDGYSPAPFKAQNMALNSFVTKDGLEIGRAQAVQAEACCLELDVNMNPILLKPNSDHTSQVILMGKPLGNRQAYSYYQSIDRENLREIAQKAFLNLCQKGYSPIVMEGAGSVSEINLKATDIVNMPMAKFAKADVILIADIDRGGVFASCYGSIMLLEKEYPGMIKGIIINKFRGDIRLFEKGRKMMEDICLVPVLGVVPMFKDIIIDAEDSLEIKQKSRTLMSGKINIAVILFRHISNFTDFSILEMDERVNLFYTLDALDVEKADIIILPGTKSTLEDLLFLRKKGLAKAIIHAHGKGKKIMGICGGFQMLGLKVSDPNHIEGEIEGLPGLGLLPIETVMQEEKLTRQKEFTFRGSLCHGYEIHQGRSTLEEPIIENKNLIGTYIHGILDNKPIIDYLLKDVELKNTNLDIYQDDFKQRQYDLLAEHVRKYVDIEKIYKILQE
ncbi:MAG: cobyric acid synthase [Prevotella sp.]|nr:cobyric acid synthase [Prevotella sp.]